MGKFILSFKRKGTIHPVTPDQPVTPSGSDLVKLGILPKQISEFTNSDIGTTVLIPYTDPTGKILLNDGKIEFEVVGVNHHTTTKYPKTITLMTKHVIRDATFDAKESSNSDSNRVNSGNNRWSVSNIRQWLNSGGAAGKWFTAQHEYDAPPTSGNVTSSYGAYADAPGFLAGFSSEVFQHFTNIENTTALCSVDGGGSETTIDKVFLPSYTEMTGYNNNEIAEGTWLSVKYKDDNSRIKSTKDGAMGEVYWTRSPFTSKSAFVTCISDYGWPRSDEAFVVDGVAPIIVLH